MQINHRRQLLDARRAAFACLWASVQTQFVLLQYERGSPVGADEQRPLDGLDRLNARMQESFSNLKGAIEKCAAALTVDVLEALTRAKSNGHSCAIKGMPPSATYHEGICQLATSVLTAYETATRSTVGPHDRAEALGQAPTDRTLGDPMEWIRHLRAETEAALVSAGEAIDGGKQEHGVAGPKRLPGFTPGRSRKTKGLKADRR